MWLVLLGAPGAGKGTQADFITAALGVPVISTGNLLRRAIRENTPLGQIAQQYINDGNLVPDEVVIDLIREKLADPELTGAIFDGFPRTTEQAKVLDTIVNVDHAISIEVQDDVIIHRMEGRRTCPTCQTTFHTEYNAPKQEGVCDKCGSQLVIRKDDRPEVVRDRLATYHQRTEPVKQFYAAQGKLRLIPGEGSITQIRDSIAEVLGVTL